MSFSGISTAMIKSSQGAYQRTNRTNSPTIATTTAAPQVRVLGTVHWSNAGVHLATKRMPAGLAGQLALIDTHIAAPAPPASVATVDDEDLVLLPSASDSASPLSGATTTCLCWSADELLRRTAAFAETVGMAASISSSSSNSSTPLVLRVPVADIVSLRICQPAPLLSSPFVVVLTAHGQLPPFLLKLGGAKELLDTLQRFVPLATASNDGDLFVRQDQDDNLLNRSLTLFQIRRGRVTLSDPLSFAAPTRSLLNSSRDELLVYIARTAAVDAAYRQLAPTPEEIASFRAASGEQLRRKEARAAMATELGEFALVDEDGAAANVALASSPPETRRMRSSSTVDGRALGRSVAPPLTFSELLSMCDADGKFSDVTQLRVRQCAFYVGVVRDDDIEPSGDDEDDPSLTFEARRALWRFLLRGATPALSRGETQKLAVDYARVKSQWESIASFPEQVDHFAGFRDRQQRVDKDVVRTDRTLAFYRGETDAGAGPNANVEKLRRILMSYAFFNYDVGYVQGMNDLLAPILFVFQGDEAEAFWCFVALMRQRAKFFDADQAGMTLELEMLGHALRILDAEFYDHLVRTDSANCFFAYRWLLCLFKRELSFPDTLRLWEVLWSGYLTDRMQTFVAVAMILSQRDEILSKRMQFDEILHHVNKMSRNVDLDAVLSDAERFYTMFQRHLATAPADSIANNIRAFFDT